jgi:MATE family multidrug resistance protein
MATTGLVAQSHGAEDEERLMHHFGRAFLIAMLIGAAILLVQAPLISIALKLLGASPETAVNARVYCSIRIWSAPASLANYTILGYLLGRQRARAALLLQASINVVNVLVALALVLGLRWGVAGIATATLSAEWTGCLMGLAILLTGGVHPRRLRWSELLHGPSLRHLFALNRDILLRTISLVAAYAWFTRSGARMGDAILAANAVLLNFHMIASYGLDGFANATEALVGEAIGAGRRADFRSILKATFVASFAVSGLVSLAYWGFGTRIIAIFTNQEPIRQLAAQFLPWIVAMPVVSVWNFQLDGIFIGATRAPELRDSMILSFLGFLGLAVVLQARFGNSGLWCAMLAFMALRAVTLGLRLPKLEARSFPAQSAQSVTPVF